MQIPAQLDPDALRGFLDAYGVGEAQHLSALTERADAASYRLRTREGEYVLTRFAPDAPAETLDFVLDWTGELAAAGLPCAAVLRDTHGDRVRGLDEAPAILRPLLAGAPVTRPSAGQCEALGRTLGRVHRLGAGATEVPPFAYGLRWWREAARRLQDTLDSEGRALLEEEIRFQDLFRLSDLPSGPIHGTPMRFNVRFSGDELTALTGWWSAGAEALLFDLASAANDACSTPDLKLDPTRLQALLTGYRAERPFSAMERGAWPVMLRGAALRGWLAGLTGTDPRLDADHHRGVLRQRVGNRERLPR